MRTTSLIGASLAGAVFSATLILACSDDSPTDADAAVCDCPAAEPPLQGRVMSIVDTVTIAANGAASGGVACPAGATLLGGGCRIPNTDTRVLLSEAGPDRNVPSTPGYVCQWISTAPSVVMAQVEAICLMAAQ